MRVRIEESWRRRLQPEFDKPYFARLAEFVREEYRTQRVCPVNRDLFRVFDLCPFDRVRVVILGQDPYPDPRFYYGICFSVPDGLPVPGSLQNIFREIHDDTGRPVPASGRLERWVVQGVLPMNSILTVRAFRSGSHRDRGWEMFTDAVIRRLNDEREHLVFMLWGLSWRFRVSAAFRAMPGYRLAGLSRATVTGGIRRFRSVRRARLRDRSVCCRWGGSARPAAGSRATKSRRRRGSALR